jgi:2'-deoxynucleoside 5'-phosphate N-hydrolase
VRVYLACTVRGSRDGVAAARVIASRLEARGHEVMTAHLLRDDVDSAEAAVGDEAVFSRDLEWLERCDLLVAEASGSSYGVGFEVGYITGRAAVTGQSVLVLYDEARKPALSRFIPGYKDKAGCAIGYTSLDDLALAVDRYLETIAAARSRG